MSVDINSIRNDIESLVARSCDGTYPVANGEGILSRAYFPEFNNPPQKLADELVAYIEKLIGGQ